MKIDTSKLSNKGDAVVLLGLVVTLALFGLVFYLAATANTFLAGFVAATIVWRWKAWVYEPIDRLLERCWPGDLSSKE